MQTALVTGATSGLGFEAAAQLADSGVNRVMITGRSAEKAEAAGRALTERTGCSVFVPVVLDNDNLATVEAAAKTLVASGAVIDLLILNAGIAPPSSVTMSADGFERTISSSLIGHHVLAARLLETGLLTANARIVIASSAAARGDVPTFVPVDFRALASGLGGDLEAAVEAQMRMSAPAKYKAGEVYATAKVLVAQWAAEMASRVPSAMAVSAVSPGSTPETNVIRNGTFIMRHLMVPFFKLIPGMSHSVADGARRYLDAADRGTEVTGKFLGSAPKKLTGALHTLEYPHIQDKELQQAAWAVTVRLTGVDVLASARSAKGTEIDSSGPTAASMGS
jgi:NAD(P)-dependent dehydrogenase (short-subunit alcohol dehydrogenase family)